MPRSLILTLFTVLLAAVSAIASAGPIAIVQGGFYTSDLFDALTGAGADVTEITTYDAGALAGYDSVIHYGNSFTDTAALTSYVDGGGTLVLTPWAGLNFSVPADLQVFGNGGGASYSETYPGVTVLDAGNALLDGVTFPAAGGFDIGRITGIDFAVGATGIADWADGDALLGTRTYGAGTVVGINMHVITSDTAFDVINQPWATQLLLNATGAGTATAAVPAPATLALLGLGLLGLTRLRRKA